MKKLLILIAILLPFGASAAIVPSQLATPQSVSAEQIYRQAGLSEYVTYKAFEAAYAKYVATPGRNKEILTLIDFSKPSSEERMVVIDMANRQLLFHSIVSHGRGSGELYATSFGNTSGCHKSSLGTYLTEGTYQGRNGYSLVLNGLERGVNDNAKARAIVMHGADYCSRQTIAMTGRLGRSHGCPALPRELNKTIIDTIKGGSLLYIFA